MEQINQGAEQLGKGAEAITNSIYQGTDNVYRGAENIRETINNNVKEFATNTGSQSKSFLESNSIIAKFAFLLLVLILFFILANLGIKIIGYFLQPYSNVYVIRGLQPGTSNMIITQDPKKSGSKQILRSDNQTTGIEFTWSTWLNISTANTSSTKYQHIFSKGGNGTFDATGVMNVNNAPGLYIAPSTQTNGVQSVNLTVFMNTVNVNNPVVRIDVPNVPINKWFHVIIRLENKIMDIYVNGTITKRQIFTDVPLQNYDDIYACYNGGFSGSLSNLQYFSRALNVFEINSILNNGPNTTSYQNTMGSGLYNNGYYYLSNKWYAS